MTVAAIIAGVLALLLLWKKKLPKITTLLAIIAGAGLTTGWIGRTTNNVVDWAGGLVSSITRSAAGESVPAVLGIIALFIVVHDLWRTNSASRLTVVAAFFLPAVAALIPGPVGEGVRSVIGGMAGLSADAVTAAIES